MAKKEPDVKANIGKVKIIKRLLKKGYSFNKAFNAPKKPNSKESDEYQIPNKKPEK